VPKAIGIIPARYHSKRFPGKALALIGGVPLIVRVLQSAQKSSHLDEVIVATDDQNIANTVTRFGGRVIITNENHTTGSDRIAEAAQGLDCDFIVNIQGDEPFISAEIIDQVTKALENPDIVMSSACAPLSSFSDFSNPNAVKVVLDQAGDALYFSRSPIPFFRYGAADHIGAFRHIGIYGFKKEFLGKFAALPQTPLEIFESLEQLRALEHGYKIRVLIVDFKFAGIDSPDDLALAEEILLKQGLNDGR
jgi:3-deoxy-manno-octulosonate cytidylyltransferase (CMP-KDO synthetase)